MNLSKSLKVKNRLVGELVKLQEIAKRENSRRNDNVSKVDCGVVFNQIGETRAKLVTLKSAIVEASVGISLQLAELAELKTYINWLSSLPVREGEEKVAFGSAREPQTYIWTATINRENLDSLISNLQGYANTLQDEIDEFNAKTQVNWEG